MIHEDCIISKYSTIKCSIIKQQTGKLEINAYLDFWSLPETLNCIIMIYGAIILGG